MVVSSWLVSSLPVVNFWQAVSSFSSHFDCLLVFLSLFFFCVLLCAGKKKTGEALVKKGRSEMSCLIWRNKKSRRFLVPSSVAFCLCSLSQRNYKTTTTCITRRGHGNKWQFTLVPGFLTMIICVEALLPFPTTAMKKVVEDDTSTHAVTIANYMNIIIVTANDDAWWGVLSSCFAYIPRGVKSRACRSFETKWQ